MSPGSFGSMFLTISLKGHIDFDRSILPVGSTLPGVNVIIGEHYQLYVSSASVFDSYLGDPAEFKLINNLQYFNTGDIFEPQG